MFLWFVVCGRGQSRQRLPLRHCPGCDGSSTTDFDTDARPPAAARFCATHRASGPDRIPNEADPDLDHADIVTGRAGPGHFSIWDLSIRECPNVGPGHTCDHKPKLDRHGDDVTRRRGVTDGGP